MSESDSARWIWYVRTPGYKYHLTRRSMVQTSLEGHDAQLSDGSAHLDPGGRLVLNPGFEWDGLSGAPDRARAMRAGCAHDALYRMLREGELPQECRADADRVFEEILRLDAVHPVDIAVIVEAVRALGADAARPEPPLQEQFAP